MNKKLKLVIYNLNKTITWMKMKKTYGKFKET